MANANMKRDVEAKDEPGQAPFAVKTGKLSVPVGWPPACYVSPLEAQRGRRGDPPAPLKWPFVALLFFWAGLSAAGLFHARAPLKLLTESLPHPASPALSSLRGLM